MAERQSSVLTQLRQPRVLIPAILLLLVAAGGVGYLILLRPNSLLVRWAKADLPDQVATITIGPYPEEKDFERLKREKVKYVVSLLDPRIPYEKPMLERELTLGQRYGVTVKSFPLFPVDSMLNTEFFSGSLEEEKKAVAFLAHVDGRSYVHCYLGRHRALRVRDALLKSGVPERYFNPSELDNVTSAAWEAFRKKEYVKVLEIVTPVMVKNVELTSLAGWAHFRLNQFDAAAHSFREGLQIDPTNPRNLLGLGYCYVRQGEPVMAQRQFGAVLEQIPDNREALTGLGVAHMHLGNNTAAAQLFRRVLEMDPGNEDVSGYLKKLGGS